MERELEGLSLPRLEEKPAAQGKEPVYMVEDRDGFLTRVPAEKLADWERAQELPEAPLNRAERLLRDKIVQRIFGGRE